MSRRLSSSLWVGLALAAFAPARAAVQKVPAVASPVGGATASAAPVAADALGSLRLGLAARGETVALEAVQRLHYTDSLTGLPNRAYLLEHGEDILKRSPNPTVSMLDMNNFGAVNTGLADRLGVTKGRARADAILAVAGGALGELAREHEVAVFRLGGEEFAVLGSREKVLSFAGAARRALPSERLLEAAGLTREGVARRAVDAAMVRLGRGGQPVGDFTYGVAGVEGRTVTAALEAADGALTDAKEAGGRGGVFLAGKTGWTEWTQPAAKGPLRALPAPAPADTAGAVARLEERLTQKELALFRAGAFKDPLTLARGYDYVSVRADEWDGVYKGGGAVAALLSARNLKQINDILGHAAGDAYLASFGRILQREVDRSRRGKLDVQEPVRVASKEFLLVGRDAAVVARRAVREVERKFDGGMLTRAQVSRLRGEAVAKGLIPEGREGLIGTLRLLSEPLTLDGRTDVRGALDRAFERLEAQKRSADAEGVLAPR